MLESIGHGLTEVLCRNLPGGTMENHENLSRDSKCLVWNSNRAPPEDKYRMLPLHLPAQSFGEFNMYLNMGMRTTVITIQSQRKL
jgi:hypothetical protein